MDIPGTSVHSPAQNALGDDKLHNVNTTSSEPDSASPLNGIIRVCEIKHEIPPDVQPEKSASADIERDSETTRDTYVSFLRKRKQA